MSASLAVAAPEQQATFIAARQGKAKAAIKSGSDFPGVIDAKELSAMPFSQVRWAVPGILPEGLTLLAGSPKIGKSWLALGMCIAVAAGGRAFGRVPCDPGRALYLALEDNPRRLKSRMEKLLAGGAAPPSLHLTCEWPRLGEGCEPELQRWLQHYPDTRLIVVDTMQRIRQTSGQFDRRSAYETDYGIGAALLPIAKEANCSIVLIHHTNRNERTEDALEKVSGTNGLAGGMDGVIVIRRDRGNADAFMYVTGRDVEREHDYAMRWDAQTAQWTIQGDAGDYRVSPGRTRVIELLRQHGPLLGKQLAELLNPGVKIEKDSKEWATTRQLLKRMREDGQVVQNEEGSFALPPSVHPHT